MKDILRYNGSQFKENEKHFSTLKFIQCPSAYFNWEIQEDIHQSKWKQDRTPGKILIQHYIEHNVKSSISVTKYTLSVLK